ncbi:MAG: DUF960 family protein [Lactobacillales bacterium]|jgi:hypothetical protein|nr:DUF960 family protein [Lactobacillales bacterium]
MKEKLVTQAIDETLSAGLIESLWRLYDEKVAAQKDVAVFFLKEQEGVQHVEVEVANQVVVMQDFPWKLLGWTHSNTGIVWIGNDEKTEIMTFPKIKHQDRDKEVGSEFDLPFFREVDE